jgi:hypothetical protein
LRIGDKGPGTQSAEGSGMGQMEWTTLEGHTQGLGSENGQIAFSCTSHIKCHRQIFGCETLSNLTAKSNAIEMKRGLQVLYEGYSLDSVAL